jgi:hypothetical protein
MSTMPRKLSGARIEDRSSLIDDETATGFLLMKGTNATETVRNGMRYARQYRCFQLAEESRSIAAQRALPIPVFRRELAEEREMAGRVSTESRAIK